MMGGSQTEKGEENELSTQGEGSETNSSLEQN